MWFIACSVYILVSFLFQMMDIPGLNINQGDYYPYVYYQMNLDFIETDRR